MVVGVGFEYWGGCHGRLESVLVLGMGSTLAWILQKDQMGAGGVSRVPKGSVSVQRMGSGPL